MKQLLIVVFSLGLSFSAFGQLRPALLAPTVFRTVSNMQASVPLASMPIVETAGYYDPGDGGGGKWRYVAAGSETLTNWPATDGGYWEPHQWDGNARQFGAVGDGLADDTVALRRWLQSGAKRLYLPEGTYKITNTVSAPNIGNNVVIDWHGVIRAADGINYHMVEIGSSPGIPTAERKPTTTATNLTIRGYGVGGVDGNSFNAAEYFPDGVVLPPHGGHGLHVMGVHGLTISGFVAKNVPMWAVTSRECIDVKFLDSRIDTGLGNNSDWYNTKNQDGFHALACAGVQVANCWVASSDDNYAFTSWKGIDTTDVVLVNSIGIHRAVLSDTGFFTRGFNVRITQEAGWTNSHIERVLISNCTFTGGYGMITMQNLPGSGGMIRDVRVQNTTFADKPPIGTNSTPNMGIIISQAERVTFSNVTFRNFARFLVYGQTVSDFTFENCLIEDHHEDPYLSYVPTIILAAPQVGNTGGDRITFRNNEFRGIHGIVYVVNGGSDKLWRNVRFIGDYISDGPTTQVTRPAYDISNVGGILEIRDGNLRNWNGTGGLLRHNSDVRIVRNTTLDVGATNSAAFPWDLGQSNGVLGQVEFVGNTVANAARTVVIGNAERLVFTDNTIWGMGRLTSSSGTYLSLTGDGGLPITTNIDWTISGNRWIGGNAVALNVGYINMPSYAGKIMYLGEQNYVAPSHAIPYQLGNTNMGKTWQRRTSRQLFGSIDDSQSPLGDYFRYAFSGDQAVSGSYGLFIERNDNAGAAPKATQSRVVNVLYRNSGTGGATQPQRSIEAMTSWDQATNATSLQGVYAGVRQTVSGGTASVASSLVAQYTSSQPTVASETRGVFAMSPTLSGGALVTQATGIYVDNQQVPGVTHGYSLRAEGANTFLANAGTYVVGSSQQFGAGGAHLLATTNDPPAMAAPNGSIAIVATGAGAIYARLTNVWVRITP